MQKSKKKAEGKEFLKKLFKALLYITAFIIFVFLSLSVSSYFWLEEQKMDMSDMMSFEQFDDATE